MRGATPNHAHGNQTPSAFEPLRYGIVAPVDGLAGLDAAPGGSSSHGKHRADSSGRRRLAQARPDRIAATDDGDVFTRFAADYAAEHRGRALTLLQAGCTTCGSELDLAALVATAPELVISRVDDDNPVVHAAAADRPELSTATFAELRTLTLAPRSVDLIQCSMLLHRIRNAELVLDRLVGTLRPGGLLFLRTADRDTAAGFLDRKLPEFARELAWRAAQPGQPGPFPAYYERIASGRGIETFVVRHGLAIANRQACIIERGPGRPEALLAAQRLVRRLSRRSRVADYDELRYVIRKPQDRYARVLTQ
jgi:SAM-dependent methyltransferase